MSDTAVQAAELAAVLGAEKEIITIKIAGADAEIEVTPLRLKQLADVLKCLKELGDLAIRDSGLDPLADMILQGGDVGIRLLAIASGLKQEAIEELELDDAAKLAGAVMKVNRDFFSRKGREIAESLGIDLALLKMGLASPKSPPTSSPAASQTSES